MDEHVGRADDAPSAAAGAGGEMRPECFCRLSVLAESRPYWPV
jgi:hypothetical protein